MAIKITKAEFDALPEALRSKFKASGNADEYEMAEAPAEDVSGLKAAKETILREKKELQKKLDELEKFRADHESAEAKAAEELLAKKGEFDKILEQKEKAWQERIAKAEAANAQMLGNLKTERIKNFLTSKGVIADRLKAAMAEGDLDNILELESGESGFNLKKKGGIGDDAELEAILSSLKEKADYLFEAHGTSGSGANGSGSTGGTGKTMARQAFSGLSAADQMAFSKGGGTLTD